MEEIPMYAAMKSVGVTDEKAERVVQALDDKIDNKVNFGINAVRGDIAVLRGELVRIEAEIAKVDSKVDRVDSKVDQVDSKVDHKVDSIRWIIGILVPVCAILVTAAIAYITH